MNLNFIVWKIPAYKASRQISMICVSSLLKKAMSNKVKPWSVFPNLKVSLCDYAGRAKNPGTSIECFDWDQPFSQASAADMSGSLSTSCAILGRVGLVNPALSLKDGSGRSQTWGHHHLN